MAVLKILRIGRVNEGDIDTDAREGVAKLVVGTAVQAAAADDVVAGNAQAEDGEGLGGMPGTDFQGANAAFEVGQALFEHIRGGVHDAGVDVAQLFQGEQVGGVFGAFELVAGGLVDGDGDRTSGWVGRPGRRAIDGWKNRTYGDWATC